MFVSMLCKVYQHRRTFRTKDLALSSKMYRILFVCVFVFWDTVEIIAAGVALIQRMLKYKSSFVNKCCNVWPVSVVSVSGLKRITHTTSASMNSQTIYYSLLLTVKLFFFLSWLGLQIRLNQNVPSILAALHSYIMFLGSVSMCLCRFSMNLVYQQCRVSL